MSVALERQPRATARVKDVRELRAVIQVRSVARLVRARAKRDLADRPETLNCRLLVLHSESPPRNGECLAFASGRPNWPDPYDVLRHLCAATHIPALTVSRMRVPQIATARRSGHRSRLLSLEGFPAPSLEARAGARRSAS